MIYFSRTAGVVLWVLSLLLILLTSPLYVLGENPTVSDQTSVPLDSVKKLGEYVLPFYFAADQLLATIEKESEDQLIMFFNEPDTYSPHNVEMLITSTDGELIYQGNPQPEIGFVRPTTAQSSSGEIFYCGYALHPNTNLKRHDFLVFSITPNGVMKDVFRYDVGIRAACITICSDSTGMLLAGIGYSKETDLTNKIEGVLLRTDSTGQEIWRLYVNVGDWCEIYSAVLLENGDVLACGYSSDIQQDRSDLSLFKLDNSGNLLWYKTLYEEGFQYARVAFTDKNGIVLFITDTDDNTSKAVTGFRLYDPEGNLKNRTIYTYSDKSVRERYAMAKPAPNGNYYLLVNVIEPDNTYFILREISPEGKVLWARRYLEGFNTIGANLCIEGENEIYLITTIQECNSEEQPRLALLSLSRK